MSARIFMLEHYGIFIYIICTITSHIACRMVYRRMYDLPWTLEYMSLGWNPDRSADFLYLLKRVPRPLVSHRFGWVRRRRSG